VFIVLYLGLFSKHLTPEQYQQFIVLYLGLFSKPRACYPNIYAAF
jgi:hypothetical protein